jgi:ABC-type uncharacterized transport system substrate-binding protein
MPGLRLLPALAFMVLGPAADAHPHVWATMHNRVIFGADGKIAGTRVAWTFDKAYTAVAVQGLDTDGDGKYSAGELAPLTALNLQSLKTYDYFIFFRKNGDVVKIGDATDTTQSYDHGQLTLEFSVPLVAPLDPRNDQVKLKVYDPEFFIDFEYANKQPVGVIGAIPAPCRTVLTPIPNGSNLNQTRLMLSAKGIDWKPDNNEDFGGMFAQAILIVCGE